MLLILIAWDVREQAVSPAMETAAAQTLTVQEAEDLRLKIEWEAEEADLFAENFVRAKQKAEEELVEHQSKLALAERETQKIKDELARLEQLAQQLNSQTPVTPEEVEYLKRLLAQQQQRKEEAELELAQLQKEAAQKEKSYAIIPYRGPDGTFRRPIYIECNNDKIIIQPEGVELVPGDFQVLDSPGNPFDTALRVIRQYYVETGQIVRGSEPYPLLIVRPSGVEMFSNAMQAVFSGTQQATGNWVKDYGYEIVCEDWNMQYPEPNDELRRRILQQLEISRNRLSSYMVAQRMADRQGGGYGNDMPQFRVNHRGEVVPVGGQMRGSVEIRGGEEMQRQLAANRQMAGQRAGNQVPLDQESGDTMPRSAVPHGTAADGTNEANQKSPSAERMTDRRFEQATGAEMPEQQMSMMPQMQNPPQRPQNWGLKGATQFSSSLSRTVRIRCEADRFVLPAQAGLAAGQEIPIGHSVSAAADQLVQAVWEFQNSWDSAGENMHWRPILKVQVSPGGERRLQELKIHLRNSGLVVEE